MNVVNRIVVSTLGHICALQFETHLEEIRAFQCEQVVIRSLIVLYVHKFYDHFQDYDDDDDGDDDNDDDDDYDDDDDDEKEEEGRLL